MRPQGLADLGHELVEAPGQRVADEFILVDLVSYAVVTAVGGHLHTDQFRDHDFAIESRVAFNHTTDLDLASAEGLGDQLCVHGNLQLGPTNPLVADRLFDVRAHTFPHLSVQHIPAGCKSRVKSGLAPLALCGQQAAHCPGRVVVGLRAVRAARVGL